VAEINKEDLKGLGPEERIKKLKELEEEKRKEIEEAEKLINETIADMENESRLASLAIPETPTVDIAELFNAKGSDLESTVEIEMPGSASSEEQYKVDAGEAWSSYIPGGDGDGGKVEETHADRMAQATQAQYLADVHVGSKAVKYQSEKHQKG